MKNLENLSQEILKLLRSKNYVPSDLGQIAIALNLERGDIPQLNAAISKMVKEGCVLRVKNERYAATNDLDLIAGTIEFRPNGKASIRTKEGKVVSVRREDTGVALDGDKVIARKIDERKNKKHRYDKYDTDESLFAKVIRIIERKREFVVGTLKKSWNFWHIIPDDPRFYYDVIVADPSTSKVKAEEGDKVIVRLNAWEVKNINPSGEITENLGQSHTPMAEYKAILVKYDLAVDFPEAVLQEVKNIPKEVTAADIEGRLDLRNEFTMTIDPSDAKDFDDAISIGKNGKLIRIGVHIADVSYYVKGGTALDKEARKRGNSTYLVGTVLPMLPFELSNGICSLLEGQDRLVKSVFLEFDTIGDCKSVHFANSVIRSNKRLSYKQAYALLTENDIEKIKAVKTPDAYATGATGKPLSECSDEFIGRLRFIIRQMWSIASTLRKRRMKKGSLDLDMPETRIFLDAEGYAARIEKLEYDESHQLIEEFMLAANEAVARELFDAHLPYISRVHDDPDEEKLMDLREFLEPYGIQTGDLTRRRELMKVLNAINKHPQSYILKTQLLRSLKRAVYRASADGHFGLMKDYYAHFTSPIRRYADFTVHRTMNYHMQLTKDPTAPKQKQELLSQSYLEGIADHISKTEANSTEAERESRKVKMLEFFDRILGKDESFDAIVTSMNSHGFFVELTGSLAYGYVHLHSLHDDIYKLNAEGNVFRGRRTGNVIKVGDRIKVAVETVDLFKRQIDFIKLPDEKRLKKSLNNR